MTVICLGEALIDLTPHHGDSIEDTDGLAVQIGGAPLNVALHLNRAGVDAQFVGTLSSDGFGSRIRALLKNEGVDYYPATPVNALTRLAVINRLQAGSPFTFYGDRPADTRLTTRVVNAAFRDKPRALYVSSLLVAHRSSARAQKHALLKASASEDILVVSDPNPRPSVWPSHASMLDAVEFLLHHSSLVKLSLDDARALGWPTSPEELLAKLQGSTSGAVVISDGSRGSWYSDEAGVHHVPATSVVEVDPTGAGDAYFANVIAGFLREGKLTDGILKSASDIGASVAGRPGSL